MFPFPRNSIRPLGNHELVVLTTRHRSQSVTLALTRCINIITQVPSICRPLVKLITKLFCFEICVLIFVSSHVRWFVTWEFRIRFYSLTYIKIIKATSTKCQYQTVMTESFNHYHNNETNLKRGM